MEAAAAIAITGTQPAVRDPQPALPVEPAKPSTITWAKMKKLATLDDDATNAAAGVGAPSYASGAHKWNGTAATLNPKPTTVITIATISSGSSGPCVAAAIFTKFVEPDSP